MNGQMVVVKDFMGLPHLCKVSHANGSVVFVTSPQSFDDIKSGQSNLYPIGFKAESVFKYKGGSLPAKVDWNKMEQWSP
jgi:hypothetical protein